MPTFVIHAIGQPSKKVSFPKGPIRVGREPSNHLVLGDKTVSREHAVFQQDFSRRWYVSCVSETNPVVVDGQMVTRRKYVQEGSEILVGKEHLVVFCASEATAAQHLDEAVARSTCVKCGWAGMRGNAGRGACPDCGSRELVSESAYTKEREVEKAKEGVTSLMSPAQLGNILGRLKAAKGSHLERLDGREPGRHDLSESEPIALGAKAEGALKLFGLFVFGGGVTIAWDGSQFVARSRMVFPPMYVNGYRRKEAALKHGDVLRVGSNQLRFVIEESAPRRPSVRPPAP
jgi:pSer/pThr/pTyr-binding forkhead associated (FHA) protein